MEFVEENKFPDQANGVFDFFCGGAVRGKRRDVLERLMNLDLECSECKSPIEIIFKVTFDCLMSISDKDPYVLIPQYEVLLDGKTRYVLDFAYVENGTKIAVECDGHDFHEKTVDQVNYGHKRDYDLQRAGFDVLHFSGSQIVVDPIDCAIKVSKFITSKQKNGE